MSSKEFLVLLHNQMITRTNDIDNKTEEAEERNAPEAKVVEASHFQCERAGSSPVGSTKGDEMIIGKQNTFNWTKKDFVIAGRAQSRLSVLT